MISLNVCLNKRDIVLFDQIAGFIFHLLFTWFMIIQISWYWYLICYIHSRFLKHTLRLTLKDFSDFFLGPNNFGGVPLSFVLYNVNLYQTSIQPVLSSPWCSAAWCLATLAALGKNLKQTSHWTRFLSCRVWLANTSGWLVRLWYHRPDSCCGNRERHIHKHTTDQLTITSELLS